MREDRTRSKNYNLNCNLAALRVCLISLKARFYPDDSWPSMQEKSQHDPAIPFQMIVNENDPLKSPTPRRKQRGILLRNKLVSIIAILHRY